MSDKYRKERIERLLDELKYEITRGMLESEIDETLGFRFFVPISKRIQGGFVLCEFKTRPIHRDSVLGLDIGAPPKLTVVK